MFRPWPPYFGAMWGARTIFAAIALLAGLASFEAAAQGACLSPDETRAAVAQGGVVAPQQAVSAARDAASGGEVVRAELCRQGGGYVYRISVLRRDGRVMRIVVDGGSGRVLEGR
ncbi:PepSY domain-containing protein [Chelatococcus sp. GW1]|uniref:PepSY domain-containing protein n=2 Tax=unclassified Chelatococcus TaxID=2638111 RepID=UPI00068518D9|nr:PepSY domain-containing protein [Chelatococcus sp. GW1]